MDPTSRFTIAIALDAPTMAQASAMPALLNFAVALGECDVSKCNCRHAEQEVYNQCAMT